ncbi:MAG: pseudouridine synthase [Eubacteriales bacterium]|nr:pseudouridine synthase [Eubacteriales bacterium]
MKAVRLDKFLADAGIGTRSEVKKFVYWNRVKVNGKIVKDPGMKIEPDTDEVTYKDEPVRRAEEFVYYLLHKPAGCVSATEDKLHKTVLDYVPKTRKGLFPVGRLDKDTEGLLLITNDGALAHELLAPGKHVEKTYYALVEGRVTQEDILSVREGLDIGEKKNTLPACLEILSAALTENGWQSEIHITICEGKYHQVKRMMEALGKRVLYLKRLSMGGLTLPESLEKGQYQKLSREEAMTLLFTDGKA